MIKVLGVITARGGSKRVPGKNVKHLGGIPLIGHTLREASHSDLYNHCLSTDSDIIADVDSSIMNFDRPWWLATDRTPHLPVMIHAVEKAKEFYDYDHDAVMILQPTSPFRTERHINEAIRMMESGGYDTVVGVDVNNNPNGAIYLFRTELLFSKNPSFYGEKVGYLPMNTKASLNIDTPEDFKLAEDIISNQN